MVDRRRWLLGSAITVTGGIYSTLLYLYGDTIKTYLSTHGYSNDEVVFFGFATIGVIWIGVGLIVVAWSVAKHYGYRITRTPETSAPAQPPQADPKWKGLDLFRDPTELEAVPPLLASAKSRVVVLAMDGGLFTRRFYSDIIKMCNAGMTFRFLFLDDSSKYLDGVGVSWSFAGNPHRALAESLERLRNVKDALSTSAKANLQVQFYDLLPIHTMTIIDPESEDGVAQVTLHRNASHEWSFLRISKREQPALFKIYWESYRFVEVRPTDKKFS